jgi:hypothetical protein
MNTRAHREFNGNKFVDTRFHRLDVAFYSMIID